MIPHIRTLDNLFLFKSIGGIKIALQVFGSLALVPNSDNAFFESSDKQALFTDMCS